MSKSVVIRTSDNNLLSIRYDEGNICLYSFENNMWINEEIIVSNAHEDFTVNIDEKNNIYMFSRDNSSNLNYSHYAEGKWTTKAILKITQKLDIPILFYSYIHDDALGLVYNMVKDDTNYILYQKMINNNWSKPLTIDSFTPLKDTPFKIIKASDDYLLIFYRKGYSIGYKELSLRLGKCGIFNIVHTTNYHFGDQSLLIKDDVIHIVYTLKSMFSVQLMYKQKVDMEFSAPYVLWEGQKIDDTIIFAIDNKIIITLVTPQGIHYGVSTDGGINFSKFNKIKSLENDRLTKSIYISNGEFRSKLNTNEIYINKIGDISIIPDMCENFYPATKQPEEHISFHRHEENKQANAKNNENKPAQSEELLIKLQEKILQYKNELQHKDMAIMQLESQLNQKKNELDMINRDFKDEFKKVSNQNRALIEKNEALEKNIDHLNSEAQKLTEEIKELKLSANRKEENTVSRKVEEHDNLTEEHEKNTEKAESYKIEPYIEDALETID